MPEYKRQHYVPRYYLRYFSEDPDRKTIGVYNIDHNKLVKAASLKQQAYESYFYGTDISYEKGLGVLDEDSARLLNGIIKSETLPVRYSENHDILLTSIFLLQSRTHYASEEIKDTLVRLSKKLSEHNLTDEGQIEELRVSISNPAMFSVAMIMCARDLTCDLHYKLVINRTSREFITSDNPVVFYNQFMEERKSYGSSTGIASKGLQVFVPLSPKHYIVLYDSGVYRMGDKKQTTLEVGIPADIEALNTLQYLNAEANLYFANGTWQADMESLLSKNRLRRKSKTTLHEVKAIKMPSRRETTLIRQSKVDIRCKLTLSFIKMSKGAKHFELGTKAIHVRNEMLCRLYNEFTEAVMKREYRPYEFRKFLKENGFNLLNQA